MDILRNLMRIPLLNRKTTDPGEVFSIIDPDAEKTEIQVFTYDKDNCHEVITDDPATVIPPDKPEYRYWINVHGLSNRETITKICRQHGIHSLVIQSIFDIDQRPKYQEFDDFSLLTIKSIVPSGNTMITEHITFILGENYLISFQERRADHFDHLRERLRQDKGIHRERGSDYLLYTMLEAILDNYFRTLQKLDNDSEQINLSDIRIEPSPEVLIMIENYKRVIQIIRKIILPIKEFTQQIEREENQFIEARHLKYFLEIRDLCLTLIDNCEIMLSSLESNASLFFSIQGHRMNQIMKTLTIVAAIFIPLTFVAGIYGMNFVNIPELEWRYGYPAVWGVIVTIVIAMIVFFKKKRWF